MRRVLIIRILIVVIIAIALVSVSYISYEVGHATGFRRSTIMASCQLSLTYASSHLESLSKYRQGDADGFALGVESSLDSFILLWRSTRRASLSPVLSWDGIRQQNLMYAIGREMYYAEESWPRTTSTLDTFAKYRTKYPSQHEIEILRNAVNEFAKEIQNKPSNNAINTDK